MTSRFRRKLHRLRRHLRVNANRASAGIEFALVAPIFFLLLLGIMEIGILFYAQNTLQYSTQQAGRLVRTGVAQGTAFATASHCSDSGTGYPTAQAWFKDQICCGISGLMTDCAGSLHVDVQNYNGGFGTSFSNTTDANGNLQPVPDNYSPGNACDVVLLRATYSWTIVTPVISWFLVNMTNGQHLLSGTTAFRNEPFVAGAIC